MPRLWKAIVAKGQALGGWPRLLLNFLWFLFIVVFVGQLGPILVIASEIWSGGCLLEALDKRASNGEFILCSTAILAGATYFIVKEYNSIHELRSGRERKSIVVLMAIFFCLWGVVLAATLLMQRSFAADLQRLIHWTVYCCSILLAFVLWVIEYEAGNAQEVIRQMKESSDDLTERSSADKAGKVAL